MNKILMTQFGSHIYGTNVPTSDSDFKAIFIPEPNDILLQKAPRTIVQNTKVNDKHQKNTPEDIDMEFFALHQYLKLLMDGQTVALDVLFTPKEFHTMKADPIWDIIQANKHEFLHSGVLSYIGYANQQAAKYGIKGTRVAAIRSTLEFLVQFDNYKKLNDVEIKDKLFWFVYKNPYEYSILNNEYIKMVEIKAPNGRLEPHIEVCNRKIPLHATVKYAREIFQKIFDEYGHRALLAEKNEGVDYKSLMHAVRVCNEANELLLTHHITFPRPEAALLLKIRKGEMEYKKIAELIENGLEEIKISQLKSTLPKEPNKLFAEKIILETYRNEILNSTKLSIQF